MPRLQFSIPSYSERCRSPAAGSPEPGGGDLAVRWTGWLSMLQARSRIRLARAVTAEQQRPAKRNIAPPARSVGEASKATRCPISATDRFALDCTDTLP